jgi:formate hydrogenlyase subunit 3/multisubunit Na+/H+ antiporter MnhD subunit
MILNDSSALLAWLIIIPLASGLITFVLGRISYSAALSLTALSTIFISLKLSFIMFDLQDESGGYILHLLGGWERPVGIALRADGLSAMMLFTNSVIFSISGLYSLGSFQSVESNQTAQSPVYEKAAFWPLWYFLWSGLNAAFLASDIFNFFVIFEVISLSSIALITLSSKPASLYAALRYLFSTLLGSLSFLLGVALLYSMYGALDTTLLGQRIENNLTSRAAAGLMIAGLIIKSALFPMHFWLPPAHSNASAPVSAVLSALVVKCTFFALARLWFDIFAVLNMQMTAFLLGTLGCLAIIWGSLQALRQRRLKLLIAYSTVAQVGYLFLLFPLTARLAYSGNGWLDETWTGIFYHLVSHALAKASLFLSAGVIIFSFRTDTIFALRGISRQLPLTSFALALAGVTLIGLPPSGGFVAKWLILKAVVSSGQWWWIPFIILGGLLTAGYVFLMIRYVFKTSTVTRKRSPVSRALEVWALLLAVISLLVGFRLEEPLQLLRTGGYF